MTSGGPASTGVSGNESSPSGGVASIPTRGASAVTAKQRSFLDLLPTWVRSVLFQERQVSECHKIEQPLKEKIVTLESQLALAEAKALRLESLANSDVNTVGAELQMVRYEHLNLLACSQNLGRSLMQTRMQTRCYIRGDDPTVVLRAPPFFYGIIVSPCVSQHEIKDSLDPLSRDKKDMSSGTRDEVFRKALWWL
eukprot:Nk52_evm1s2198 gene=Nk52_evmTU1s2198